MAKFQSLYTFVICVCLELMTLSVFCQLFCLASNSGHFIERHQFNSASRKLELECFKMRVEDENRFAKWSCRICWNQLKKEWELGVIYQWDSKICNEKQLIMSLAENMESFLLSFLSSSSSSLSLSLSLSFLVNTVYSRRGFHHHLHPHHLRMILVHLLKHFHCSSFQCILLSPLVDFNISM